MPSIKHDSIRGDKQVVLGQNRLDWQGYRPVEVQPLSNPFFFLKKKGQVHSIPLTPDVGQLT